MYYDWSKWLSETRHLILSFLPTILAYLPWAQGIINITQEPALSFFKSFPWKCSTPLNGPANAVAVMFWTAALLQDKLSCAMRLSVDFLAQRLRGHECQLVTAIWKSLINFFTSRRWLLLKCHLPSFHPYPVFHPPLSTVWWMKNQLNGPKILWLIKANIASPDVELTQSLERVQVTHMKCSIVQEMELLMTFTGLELTQTDIQGAVRRQDRSCILSGFTFTAYSHSKLAALIKWKHAATTQILWSN